MNRQSHAIALFGMMIILALSCNIEMHAAMMLDPALPQPNNDVNAMLVHGNYLYLAGTFTNVGEASRNGLAAINIKTYQVDPDWTPHLTDFLPFTLEVLGNRLYVGGSFDSIKGAPIKNLAALKLAGAESVGEPELSWNPDPNGPVFDLATDGSTLYAAGTFTNLFGNTVSRPMIAAFEPCGAGAAAQLKEDWNPSISGTYVRSMAVSFSKLYLLGKFEITGARTASNFSAVGLSGNSDSGLLDPDFSPPAHEVGFLTAGNQAIYIIRADSMSSAGMLKAFNPTNGQSLVWPVGQSLTAAGGHGSGGEAICEGLGALFLSSCSLSEFPFRTLLTALDAAPNANPKVKEGFAVPIRGRVYAFATAGNRLFVGGSFADVDGQPRLNLGSFSGTVPVTLSDFYLD